MTRIFIIFFRSFTFRAHDKNISLGAESRDSGVPRDGSRKRALGSQRANSSGFGGLSGISGGGSDTPVSGSALVRRRLDLRYNFLYDVCLEYFSHMI